METRTVQLNVQTNAATTQDEFKRLHQEIAKAEQEFEDLNNTLGETDAATVAAKQKVTDLRGAYTQLNQTATDLDGTFEQVYGQLQPLTTRMGEAEDRLYELALAGKQATQEYKDLMVATQNYLRTQQEVDRQVDAGSMPMAQKLTMAVGGVAGAFATAEGAIALYGVESQEMERTMIKLNAAVALTSGIAAVNEAIPAFKAMGAAAKASAAGVAILNAVTTVQTFVTGAATTGLKAFRIALVSTGIGALVVGIGLLVANFDKVLQLFSPLINGFKALGDLIGLTNFAAKKRSEDEKKRIDKEIKDQQRLQVVKERNFNSEQAAYERRIKLAEAEGKSTLELEKAKINASIKYQQTRKKELEQRLVFLKLLAKEHEFIGEGLGLTDSLQELSGEIEKINNDILDQQNELKILDIESKKKPTTSTSTSSTTSKTEKEKLDLTRQNRDKEIALMQEGIEKERTIIKEKYKREKEDLEANSKDKIVDKEQYAAAEKLIDQNLEKELKELREKYKEDRLKTRGFTIQGLIDDKQKEVEIEMEASMKKIEIAKEEAEKKKEIEEELMSAKFQIAKDSLQLISEITTLFGSQNEKAARRAFQVDKAAKLASATIAGIEGTIEAYKTAQKSPITAVFPAYPVIQAGLAGAFAAVNIAKISQSKFGGSTSTSPSGGGGAAAGGGGMTAQFNTIGTSGINQLATLQQQPVQAYVVSGEVTSAQSLDRNRVQNATL
jgi:hypothetical protein